MYIAARFQRVLTPAVFFLAVGCGGAVEEVETNEPAAEEQAAITEQAPPAAPSTTDSSAPLSVEDIDRWQRGLDAELKAVRDGGTRLASARTAEDSANVIHAVSEMSTLAAGAAAAGVSEDRYEFIRTTLGRAVAFLAPDPMPEMPAAMQEQAKQGRDAALARMSNELPPPVMEALRPRAAQLRQQDVTLAGERLKAAGA